MAHHQSAIKEIRKTERRTQINRNRVSRIRTFIKKVEEAITSGNQVTAKEALREAQSELMRGVNKNVMKLNTASRKISRLSARIKALVS